MTDYKNSHIYPNTDDALRGVLVEACSFMDRDGLSYIIVGGWCPLLRGGNPDLKHRGTRDVDLLFSDSVENLRRATKSLLSAGYRRSAKHDFQLMKPLNIGPSQLVGHIDLLFPFEDGPDQDLFQDILDLGIPTGDETEHVQSMALPSAKVLFDDGLWSLVPVTAVTPNGTELIVNVPIVSEAGCIFTKCASVHSKKRAGDSFDIFFLLSGPRGNAIASELKSLALNKWSGFNTQFLGLRSFLENHGDQFNENVKKYCSPTIDCAELVLRMLFRD